jgi:RNA ligase (TIGR02306 family)
MERKLATVRKIADIQEIEGADMIELAIVDGWKVVVAKNVGHKVGDMVIYCEIDSFLPIKEEFEFLRKTSYKKMSDGTEGFRLKTIKLRGQVSQGLILPMSVVEYTNVQFEVGMDVTNLLGVTKYEPPVPADLAGKVKGLFPSFIWKTDEERVQNLASEYELYKTKNKDGMKFYVTEKLDGSSATYYFKDGVFGVCSRNLELLETEGNTFWKIARDLKLEEWLGTLENNICLQGELVGEGIQGNPYKIKGQTVRFFNAFNIDTQEYLGLTEFITLVNGMKLETVPVLDTNFTLPETIEQMLKVAEDKSILNPSFDREGIVIRSTDRTISFKAISNKFLLNEK